MSDPYRSRSMPERDWRLFRELHDTLLDRYCQKTLEQAGSVIGNAAERPHERYLRLWKLLKRSDEDIALAFNDARRSTAFAQLAAVHGLGLLTEKEFWRFSAATQETVRTLVSLQAENRMSDSES